VMNDSVIYCGTIYSQRNTVTFPQIIYLRIIKLKTG